MTATAQQQFDPRNRVAERLRTAMGENPEWAPNEQEIQDELDREAGQEVGRRWARDIADRSDLRLLDEASNAWGNPQLGKFASMCEDRVLAILRTYMPKVAAERKEKRNLAFADGFFRAAMERRRSHQSQAR